MRDFYEPTQEHLTKLAQPWCCSFSGGKDSTSLVTWIEWLRRAGWITVERPQLVRSDTGVEEGNLVGVAEELTTLLEGCDWECAVVRPAVHERLYPQILGRGLPPIPPRRSPDALVYAVHKNRPNGPLARRAFGRVDSDGITSRRVHDARRQTAEVVLRCRWRVRHPRPRRRQV